MNPIRPVLHVHLSNHLFHRVHPFQAVQVGLATLWRHHRIHSPFLDRIARDGFFDRMTNSSLVGKKQFPYTKMTLMDLLRQCLPPSMLIIWKRLKYSLRLVICGIVVRTDASSDNITAAHKLTSAHQILINFVSVKGKPRKRKQSFNLNGQTGDCLPHTGSAKYESCLIW